MTVRDGFRTRCLAATLIALTVALTVTAVAEGWRRPADYAVSSPDAGDYQVCRDGIRFEVAQGQGEEPPTAPTSGYRFSVFSPPPIDPVTGFIVFDLQTFQVVGTKVGEGDVTTYLQPSPGYDAGGVFYWYHETYKGRWTGGQRLEVGQAIFFNTIYMQPSAPVRPDEIDEVENCLLFPRLVTVCRNGVTIEVPEDQVQPGDDSGRCPPPRLVTVCRNGVTIEVPEDQVQPGDDSGRCPPPRNVTVCRDGKTIVVPENQVRPGDLPGECRNKTPPKYRCAGKRATIVGTSRADKLRGTSRADVIVGLGGKDKLSGLGGNDRICGGKGNDTASGGDGNDRVYGEDGNDRLSGASGRDIIKGGAGRDRLSGGPGRDRLSGGPGTDLRKP